MSEQLSVSRRGALITASTAAAISLVDSITNAGDPGGKAEKNARSTIASPLKLKITLTDGEIVTLSAAELIIDFGSNGQLLVKPNGFLPIGRESGDSQKSDKQPNDDSKK